MTAQLMSGNLLQTILLLLQQLPVILTTHHIPVRRLVDQEQAITINLESISNYLSKYGLQPTKPSPTLE